MNATEMQATLRLRGMEDGEVGVNQLEVRVTEVVGVPYVIAPEVQARWATQESVIRAAISTVSTKLQLVLQTYGSPALTPPVLRAVTTLAMGGDWLGVLVVMRAAGIDDGRVLLSLLFVALLLLVTGGAWTATPKVFTSKERKWMAGFSLGVWVILASAVAVFRYRAIPDGMDLTARLAWVVLALGISVGPAALAAWSFTLYADRVPTWRQIKTLENEPRAIERVFAEPQRRAYRSGDQGRGPGPAPPRGRCVV